MELDSLASQVAILTRSFEQVPAAAIPPLLDCILASSCLSPLSLFSALTESFSNLLKNVAVAERNLDPRKRDYVASFMGALYHLLKKPETTESALTSFIGDCFVPLLKVIHPHDHEMINKTADSLFEVVIATQRWNAVEEILVPLFLRSVSLSMGLVQKDSSASGKICSTIRADNQINNIENDKQPDVLQFGTISVSVSCHVLTSLLDIALRIHRSADHPSNVLENGCYQIQNIAGNLMWHLCNLTIQSLTDLPENRTFIISSVLPSVFRAFTFRHTFNVCFHGEEQVLDRAGFFLKIWECCETLFSLGSVERRDAYNILSLHLSILPCHEGAGIFEKSIRDVENFDMRTKKEFWKQIKNGLVDKESIVRKQSVNILKIALNMKDEILGSDVSANPSKDSGSVCRSVTKRGIWADKEAKSMGIGGTNNVADLFLNNKQRWGGFLLLFETLEEYGTHLVEAAWKHQVTLLVQSFRTEVETSNTYDSEVQGELFEWLPILWERGFVHDNPHVRCLIMQSFLEIDWKTHEDFVRALPESFVLGPFLQALNDPVHHKDFGVKGLHTSGTIRAATRFLRQYVLYTKRHTVFMCKLAAVAKNIAFGRAGLMGLAECVSSAANRSPTYNDGEVERHPDALHNKIKVAAAEETGVHNDETKLLDRLRFVIESSKQHFNHNYRLRVCENILEAAATVVCVCDVDTGVLLHFISSLPREYTDHGGWLREKIQKWLFGCQKKYCCVSCSSGMTLQTKLYNTGTVFSSHLSSDKVDICDDEELYALGYEAKRWARSMFLIIKDETHFKQLLTFFQSHATLICMGNNNSERDVLRFHVLLLSLVDELSIMQDRTTSSSTRLKGKSDECFVDGGKLFISSEGLQKFTDYFVKILGKLISSTDGYCSMFLDQSLIQDTTLPPSVKGKLGGPSQRRLSSSVTSSVLLAITSLKTVASTASLCAHFQGRTSVDAAFTFMWNLFVKIIGSSTHGSETGGEICLAACEALVPVLKAIASSFSPSDLVILRDEYMLLTPMAEDCQFLYDPLVNMFLQYVNRILDSGVLARARRAVLIDCKWHCLESLLSVPFHARHSGVHLGSNMFFYSDSSIKNILCDVVESLENAGEGSVLPMLRSLRLILELFASIGSGLVSFPVATIDSKMVWQLVRSSWILHVSCKKRRVAPIAALLSSVIHPHVFKDIDMHEMNGEEGPLKWFIRNILEEGTKSPRTMRLAALHLTGLWLLNPVTVKYYINELKLISLYGSVQFDEDFEAELIENKDAKAEVALLAKSCDPELSLEFINTELYARVSVAALFSKLADLVGLLNEDKNSRAALESGKLFLLELLRSVVHDKDLSKELYKKFSAIHRRKTRAWQMICVLSRFVQEDIVQLVTDDLHICLNRNNMPSVRQYLETFAINVYLKFPSLVSTQLVPILRDYDMKPQALSSYVFIAANVILHANKAVQMRHLNELLPPIVPLLTSHHHSLRGFTQLLVHQVLCKLYPSYSSSSSEAQLEKECFEDLKLYLSNNLGCKRLRASMEGYLAAFDPVTVGTPAGIFTSRVEVHDFECASTSLMEQVLTFLNDVRDDLRSSMAKDADTIKNESLMMHAQSNTSLTMNGNDTKQLPKDLSFDFQKKITFNKLESGGGGGSLISNREAHDPLIALEKEDQLLEHLLQSRSLASEKMREGQQSLVIVASLIDRIPNLAGLARTCEVFKAESLAIADKSVLHDKQFQLISVTAEKWVPIVEVPVNSMQIFLEKKKQQGYSILGLEQTANSVPLDKFSFPKKTVLVLGREKEGIPVEIIHILDACIEIPQLGVVRSLNVHVSGAIAFWEYTRQQRTP